MSDIVRIRGSTDAKRAASAFAEDSTAKKTAEVAEDKGELVMQM